MSKEIKEDIIDAVEEYSLDEDLLNLYDKEKIIESDKILAKEEGIKEGFKEGIEQGIKQGSDDKAIEIAKNLLNKDIDIEIISQTTGLSIEKINQIGE